MKNPTSYSPTRKTSLRTFRPSTGVGDVIAAGCGGRHGNAYVRGGWAALGLGLGLRLLAAGLGAAEVRSLPGENLASSFLWDTEPHYLEAEGFDVRQIAGPQPKSFVFVFTPGTHRSTDGTLFGVWQETPGGRAFRCTLDPAGHLEYLQSADGAGIDLHVATRARLTEEWHTVVVSVAPAQVGAEVVKVYIDGRRQDVSVLLDTGRHETHPARESRLTLGCHFDELGRPLAKLRGFVNQFAVTAGIVTAEEALALHGNGTPAVVHRALGHVISAPYFDAAIDSAQGYVIPDHLPGIRYQQKVPQATARRRSHWVRWLNPYGLEMPMKSDDFTTDENWWTFSNQAGASFAFNAPGLRFRTEQTGTFDPDRDTCVVVSKGCYDLAKGELWVRVDNYGWDTNPMLPLTHGGFVIHDIRNDKTYLFWTHRTMSADHLGNFRVLHGINGRQRDSETSVAKGKDVFVRIVGTTVSWFYNKNGVLTQVWSDQTVDLGQHVQIRFHARDYNIYHGPRNYSFGRIRIYRSKPEDL